MDLVLQGIIALKLDRFTRRLTRLIAALSLRSSGCGLNFWLDKVMKRICLIVLLAVMAEPAASDQLDYERAFLEKVHQFANLNRINLRVLNRDLHADCYIPLIISTTITSDGSVKEIVIVESSTVPVVDRWYRWVIEQAAPYESLGAHYDPVPDQVTITYQFTLDIRLWSENVRSTRPCEPIKPRRVQSD